MSDDVRIVQPIESRMRDELPDLAASTGTARQDGLECVIDTSRWGVIPRRIRQSAQANKALQPLPPPLQFG